MQNLETNPEFTQIVIDALQDYRKWLSDEPDNQSILDDINHALDNQTYYECAYLDDALLTWSNYLNDLANDDSNPTAQANATHDLSLINQYLNE